MTWCFAGGQWLNLHDGVCFLIINIIRQTNMAVKKAILHRRIFLKIYSLIKKFYGTWQNFYFYRILNNENFKMEFEQMIFGTRLILQTYNYIYLLIT